MRIAIDARYLEDDFGGIGRYIEELLSANSERYTFICISTKPLNNIPNNVTNVVLPKSPHWIFWEQIKLPMLLHKLNPDIYHAAGNWGVPLFSPVPVVVTIHDIIPMILKEYFIRSRFPLFSRWLYYFRIRIGLSISKKIICTSTRLATELVSTFHVRRIKLDVIPMGISTEFFSSDKGKKIKNLKVGESYILSHGGLDERKNNERLIQAFAELIKSNSKFMNDTTLLITGKNHSLEKSLRKCAQELNIMDKVIFTGWVDAAKLLSLVKYAKLVVYPTLAEGFGLPLLEAMAVQVPVVASNIPTLREIGKDVPVYVDPTNVEDIARGLQEGLINYSEQRLKKGEIISQEYSWEKTIQDTFNLYSQIV